MNGSPNSPEPVYLHPLPDFIDWVEKDLISVDDPPLRKWIKKRFIPVFLGVFGFRKTYRALARDKTLLRDGEPAGARLRLMHTLLAHDYVVALEPDPNHTAPPARAATLVAGALAFRQKLREGALKDDLFKDRPLNMRQYHNLFGRSVVPAPPANKHLDAPDSEHIVVFAGRQAFRIQVIEGDRPIAADTLAAQFEAIEARAAQPAEGDRWLGALSAVNRHKAAEIRGKLEADPVNAASLNTIDTALFTVSLDLDLAPNSLESLTRLGYSGNYRNRWFEKSTQLAVFANGEAALTLCFPAYLDGTIGGRYASELYHGAAAQTLSEHRPVLADSLAPKKLEFHIDDAILDEAEAEVSGYIRDDCDIFKVESIGKDFFKSRKISPDSSIQMALLLATRKVFGHNLNMRQFINVRRFEGGTLELPYVTTQEVETFLNAAAAGNRDKRELAALLRAAVKSHKDIILKTFNGRSPKTIFNYALVGASPLKRRLARPLSAFFRWLGFKKYVSDMLGTSEHTADIITSSLKIEPGMRILGRPGIRLPFLRYFGMHYLVEPNSILFIFMPAKHCVRDLSQVASAIEASLLEIKDILLAETRD